MKWCRTDTADVSPNPPRFPRRTAAPLLATLFPLLWLLNRERSFGDRGLAPDIVSTAVLAVGAVVVAIAVATVLAPRLPDPPSVQTPLRPLVAPSDAVLAVVGAFTAALGLFVFVGVPVPPALDPVVRGVGVILGWPLYAVWTATVVVGNELLTGTSQFAAELFASVSGAALSACWLFVLGGWIARLVGRDAVHRSA